MRPDPDEIESPTESLENRQESRCFQKLAYLSVKESNPNEKVQPSRKFA
jgi:hypothetical protein